MDDRTIEVPFALARDTDEESDGLTLEGYAAVFNSPAEIRDLSGEYDEVIMPGAFARTIKARMPALMFNHGKNALWQNMPIGRIEELREDERGLFVRAKLTDNWLIHPIRDAIRDGAIKGMSFRFSVPDGKATKTRQANGRNLVRIREVKLVELGPVAMPAYSETSVAVRSLVDAGTDPNEMIAAVSADTTDVLAELERLREQIDAFATTETTVTVDVVDTSEELAREDTSEEPVEVLSDPAPSHSPSTPEERKQFARKALNDELFAR